MARTSIARKDDSRPAYAPILGQAVALDPSPYATGPFRTCVCGSALGVIGIGISTHPGHLKCAKCGKHLSWIGRSHMDALLAAHRAKSEGGAA